MKRWFLPESPDVLGLLRRQADVTIEGMDAFAGWSAGEAALAASVGDAEHAADDVRRQLQAALKAAFSTPIDPEDIYELSERLDVIINGAKNAVREAEVMQLSADGALGAMAGDLAQAVRHLRAAFAALASDRDAATTAADAAIACQRQMERRYRVAMSELMAVEDLRQVVAWREMYRRYARIGDAAVRVAERVWYAVVKD